MPTMSEHRVPTFESVMQAAERLRGRVHRTPVLTSAALDAAAGAKVYLKAENLQRTGSFKIRGALNAVSRLDAGQAARGVIAFSSGNHAQALALAAREAGVAATVVMPRDAPAGKMAATRSHGATVVTYDRYTDRREEITARLAAERGLVVIPPYEHADVISGQGTLAVELFGQVEALDVLLVPVGGGGLIAGCALAAASLSPTTRIIGVEPAEGNDTQLSLAAGRRMRIPVPKTIADGIATDTPGELTFEINRRLLSEVVLVSDDEIRAAMRFTLERLKTLIEPSAAAAVAAALARRGGSGGRVGVVVSGGNVDVRRLSELMVE
jgi:threonine dehydratase